MSMSKFLFTSVFIEIIINIKLSRLSRGYNNPHLCWKCFRLHLTWCLYDFVLIYFQRAFERSHTGQDCIIRMNSELQKPLEASYRWCMFVRVDLSGGKKLLTVKQLGGKLGNETKLGGKLGKILSWPAWPFHITLVVFSAWDGRWDKGRKMSGFWRASGYKGASLGRRNSHPFFNQVSALSLWVPVEKLSLLAWQQRWPSCSPSSFFLLSFISAPEQERLWTQNCSVCCCWGWERGTS